MAGPHGRDASSRQDRRVIEVLVEGAAARVHEEVCDRRHFESELFGDRRLHVLVGSTRLFEDGEQGATLDVGEDEARLLVDLVDVVLWCGVAVCCRGGIRQGALVMLQ